MNFSELLRIGTYTILLCVAQFSFFSIESDGRSLQVESVISRSESFRNTQPLIKLNKGNEPPSISVDASGYKNQIGNPHIYPPIVISDEVYSTNLQVVDGGLKSETLTQSGIDRGYLIRIHEWASVQVDENSFTVFGVSLRAKPSGDVQITISPFSTAGLSHTQTTPLMFSRSNYDQPQTVTVTAADDGNTVHEQESITLSASGSEYEGISKSLPVQVFDDDVSGFKIMTNPDRSMEVTETEDGNDTGKFKVWLSDRPSSTVTVTMSGFDNTDVTITGQSRLEFTPDNYSKRKTFQIKVSKDDESDDEFAHTILTASGGGYDGVSQPYRVLITDDNDEDEIRWHTSCKYCAHEVVKEGESLPLPFFFESFELVPPDGVEILFNWRTTPIPNKPRFLGGPTLTWNCSLPTESVEITPDPIKLNFTRFNYTHQEVTFTARDDENADDEYLCLEITSDPKLPSYGQPIIDNLYILIDDNDDVKGDIVVEAVSGACNNDISYNDDPDTPFKIKENCDKTPLNLKVSLTNTPTGVVTVEVPPFDNKDLSHTRSLGLNFSEHRMSHLLPINVKKDDTADSEKGSITLVAKGGGYDGKTNTITVEIEDVDMHDLIAPEEVLVQEGDSAFLEVTLGSEPTDKLQMSITGHDGSYLTVKPETVEFTPTATNKSRLPKVTLRATPDDNLENEKVRLKLNIIGSDYDRITADVDVIIQDTTARPDPKILLSPPTVYVTEGKSASFEVTLSILPTEPVWVTIPPFQNPSLTHNKSEPLNFTTEIFDKPHTVTVTAKEDDNTVSEGPESIEVTATGVPYEGVTATLTVSVTDNDVDGEISAVKTFKIDEGEMERPFYIALTKKPLDDVTVKIEGHSETDLNLSKKQLTYTVDNFHEKQTINLSAQKEVGPNEDYTNDPVNLKFTASGGGYDTTHVTEVTIGDNDIKPKVTLKLSSESIPEKGGSTTVTAALYPSSSEKTTVTISAKPDPPATMGDYTQKDTTLTIPAGETTSSGTVTITAKDNDIFGPPEKQIRVSGTASDHVDSPDDVTLTIKDDEEAPKVTLKLSPPSISENGEFTTVTATLAPPSSQTTTVTISAMHVSPAAEGDYKLSDNTKLTFEAGQTESNGTVTITANDNDIFGPPEKQIRVSGKVPDHVIAPDDVTLTIKDDEDKPKVTLKLSRPSISENGGSTTVTADLDSPSSEKTTVTISAMHVSPAAVGDYKLSDNTKLTFEAGQTESNGTVTITANDNDIFGPPEKQIRVSGKVPDHVIAPDDVTLTIKDDEDKPKVTLKLSSPSISENRGSTTVTADLDSPSSEKTTVTISATPVSPAAVGDYKLSDNTKLTFEAGQTESNGTVTITAEDNEGFGPLEKKITVSGTVPAHVIAPDDVTLTITDDEKEPRSLPTVTLSAKPNPVVEGYTTTLTATLSRPAAKEVVIELVYEDMTTEPDDYSTPPSLTIKAGESSGSRKLEILDDSIVEPDESFRVRLLKPEGIDLGNPSEVEITIRDDGDTAPPVEVTLEVKPQSVIEGKNVTVTVTLQGKLDKEVTIPLTYPLDGATAIINTDYIPVEKIVIEAGQTSNSGTIQTRPDSEEEGEETFTVAFGALPPEVSGGMHLSQEVTIVDQGQPPEVSLSVDQRRIDEGDQVTVTLKISSPLDDGVTIPLTLTNGTTTSEDYRLSGSPDLVIPGGKDEAELMIEALNDSLLEEDETFKIALSDVPNAVVQGTPSEIEMTIIDTDVPTIDAPTSVPILEGKQETITVTLGAIPLGAVSIAVTGQSGTDLSVAPSLWVFSDKAQEVTLTAGEDDDVTSDNIKLLLTADEGAYSGVTHEIQVTINDDDQPGLLVVPNPIPMDEGSSRSMEVRLTQKPSAEVPIAMNVVGAGLRLISPPELTFTTLNWDVNQSVEIMAEKDRDAEENEPVQLVLSASGGGYTGTSKTVMVTIRETDQKGLRVEPRSIEIEEGSSDEVRVSLSSQPVGEVTVGISGHEGSDVRLQPSSLTFGPAADWNTPKSLMIRAETDSDLDNDPPVRLILWARGGNYDGQQAEVEVTILDQGLPEITIYESQALENKRMIKMPITLSHPTDAVVTVQYTTQEQTGEATVGDDYTASRGIVIFDPRATSGIVQIEIIDDETPEGDETFTVILSNAKHATIARESATATIVDDDGGIPVLTIEDAVVSPDAHVVTFQIYVSQPSSQSISVRYRTADGTATAGQDYMQRSGLATITPGTVQTTIEVPLLNTEAKQQRETFYVHLESSEVAQINKAVATAVIDKEINQAQTALTEYTARFVRTLSVQLTEALQDRLRSTGSMCLAAERAEMVQRWQWTPSLGELLSGCQVSETSGHVGVWGRGAFRRFHGRDDQDLRGDVSSAIIGADYRSERGWLAGVMVAYSQGAGTYNDTDVETGLTGVYPYASYEASKWEIWMSGGYGWGHAETQILDGDLTSRFGAVGFKAQLASAGSAQLSYYGDVILTDAEVDVTDLRAEVIRVRLGIESSFALSQEVRPFVEANVRQDGGDAETGIGLEFGGGLRVAYPQWRLRGEVRSQGLVLHSADGFTEWGVSGSIQVGNPSEGLMMRVRPSWGPNHSMALYRQQTILDVAPYQSGMHRTEVEIGYGVPVSRGSVRSIVGVTELPSGRLFRLGGQLSPWTRMSLSVSGLAHHHQSNIGDMSVNVQASLQD